MVEANSSSEKKEVASPPACFVDTNVLVYAAALGAPLHRQALEELQRRHQSGQELWISRQVLREYLATLSRPQTFAQPTPIPELTRDARYLLSHFRIAEDGPAVTEKLLHLLEKRSPGGKQVHDANVVATMAAHGITELLTHNVSDFARIADIIQVTPLPTEAEEEGV